MHLGQLVLQLLDPLIRLDYSIADAVRSLQRPTSGLDRFELH